MLPAHIRQNGEVQSVYTHCSNTAEFASQALASGKLAQCGYLAGMLHDMGKCKQEFSDYLSAAAAGNHPVRGSVNHTFAGVRFVLERWHNNEQLGYSEITAELLAFAVGAHHGLFDCIDANQFSGFFHRQTKEHIGYEEALHNFLTECADLDALDKQFQASVQEMTPILNSVASISNQQDDALADQETAFHIGLLARLLLSGVIEGDRKDTAIFMNGVSFPKWPVDMKCIWASRLDYFEHKLSMLRHEKCIDYAREVISDTCAKFAVQPAGVYRLDVPTGAGKTLASLRYALIHAKTWNKDRIIFTSPLLSILDQNSAVIRDFLGDNSLILEHHSNLAEPENFTEQIQELELLTDTWESPIIITTLVQLLNTCFSGKTSAIRRFHSLCNSIIIIDEVQTVPTKMLTLFNLAINFLAKICGVTIVLCSATYPCFENTVHPLTQSPIDIVPYEKKLWEVFKRTKIQDAGQSSLDRISEMIAEELNDCASLLVVCNTKAEASKIFSALELNNCECFHLSASMCIAHRRQTLASLQTALNHISSGDFRVVCISTQVIEAGVDISFQRVIRLSAGMDSIIQSAGRCNRHAEQKCPAPVRIVQCTDERLHCLDDIVRGQIATVSLLNAFSQSPQRFEDDLSSKQAITFYYRKLYSEMPSGFQDDQIDIHGTLYQLLADNPKYADSNCPWSQRYYLRQAFRLAGDSFQVFDDNTIELLVPYEAGRDLQGKLLSVSSAYGEKDWNLIQNWIHQAKSYSISVYGYQFEKLQEFGAITSLFDDSIFLLSDGFYDKNIGFSLPLGLSGFQEV